MAVLTVLAVLLAAPGFAGEGIDTEPIPATAANASSSIHGVFADKYPVIGGPAVPPLPSPIDPEFSVHSQGAGTSVGTIHGLAGLETAGTLAQGGSRSYGQINSSVREARRSIRKVIRGLD